MSMIKYTNLVNIKKSEHTIRNSLYFAIKSRGEKATNCQCFHKLWDIVQKSFHEELRSLQMPLVSAPDF